MSSTVSTEIANIAFTLLGAARVLDIDVDVKQARAARAVWNIVRDAELTAHNWNFATKRLTLPALAIPPAWGYNNAFELPADFLSLIEVGDIYVGVSLANYRTISPIADYRIEGSTIATNLPAPLKIRYTWRVEETGLWDSAFTMAFVARLAMELCEELTQSNTKQQIAQGKYRAALIAAIRSNAIQQPPEPLPDDTWIISRRWS